MIPRGNPRDCADYLPFIELRVLDTRELYTAIDI